jgi:hypothetical protein
VQYGGPYVFRYTDPTFPKLVPRFDRRTGASSISPTPFVVQAAQDTRFRVSGTIQLGGPGVFLIRTEEPWRTDWLSSGLYDDGWTRPGTTARIRVFAAPGQQGPRTRELQIAFRAPPNVAHRRVEIVSGAAHWTGDAGATTARTTVAVCVPARGFAEVRVRANGTSAIPGDLGDQAAAEQGRLGGVFIPGIALADEVGGPCEAS